MNKEENGFPGRWSHGLGFGPEAGLIRHHIPAIMGHIHPLSDPIYIFNCPNPMYTVFIPSLYGPSTAPIPYHKTPNLYHTAGAVELIWLFTGFIYRIRPPIDSHTAIIRLDRSHLFRLETFKSQRITVPRDRRNQRNFPYFSP